MGRAKYRFIFIHVDSALVTLDPVAALAGPAGSTRDATLVGLTPDADAVQQAATSVLQAMVGGAREFVAALTAGGAVLHLLTDGVTPVIEPLARELGIPRRSLHGIDVRFAENGGFAGYDTTSVLARPGGTRLLIRNLLARSKGASALIAGERQCAAVGSAVDRLIAFAALESVDLRTTLPVLMEE